MGTDAGYEMPQVTSDFTKVLNLTEGQLNHGIKVDQGNNVNLQIYMDLLKLWNIYFGGRTLIYLISY